MALSLLVRIFPPLGIPTLAAGAKVYHSNVASQRYVFELAGACGITKASAHRQYFRLRRRVAQSMPMANYASPFW